MEEKKVRPSQIKATKNYLERKNLVEIKFRATKDKRETIQTHAASSDGSLNKFINRAIDETIERDNEKDQ